MLSNSILIFVLYALHDSLSKLDSSYVETVFFGKINVLYYEFHSINVLKCMRIPYSFCFAITKSTQKIFALQLKI